ncbi:spermidine/putrescine transport system ATP-binding protein [Mycolicibacterium sp. BK556]|uniref:ABC transporter ATP-binding protein n=1 Tax=Mycobacteriaceae TaxID=1762 RepID=UPI00105E5591|nr:ABC transporter ATP-binding protein [Mycobacterium sp. BK086]MBB3605592.1 spermidine/putrescine transport system ATP-binding protein [Mycolicibacterium sp. BK556]MBB3635911.1 spermidine/putrescine transport system ATP-binding protein [Mycolicibacterium sp. BK607]TDO08913.1 spermidine/putrescine transport system ATP-binding protein [Mycobacterium sp. BK086]
MTGGAIRLHQLAKAFDGVPAVTGIDLDIPAGQFYSLLGASGCGKTTTLRMIAGFEKPDSGRIELDGRDVAQDPPHKRPVNTVFQTYALFPFMTVWDNVAFGLKYQKTSKDETKRRVGEALDLVRMSGYAKRKPTQLSGGQQQRVALARALVLQPRVLLLDEPLGALDAKLRRQLQLELRAVQREVEITFVYVTHDQDEALTMSDQIAVLAEGRVEQVGPPQEIYSAPATTYVAGFLGAANIFDADVLQNDDGSALCSALATRLGAAVDTSCQPGPAAIVIRPERITIQSPDDPVSPGHNAINGTVAQVVYHGASTQVHVNVGEPTALVVDVPNQSGPGSVAYAAGMAVTCVCTQDAVRVLARSAATVVTDPAVELVANPA